MFGSKLFTGVGYPTPVDIPVDTSCLIVQVPASNEWWALITGLMYELTLEWNWQQYEGGLDRETAAAAWFEMWDEAFTLAAESNQCSALVPAPFWDDSDGADADDEMPANDQDWYGVLVGENTWQEQIEDWFIAAFVAIAATPAAAITFLTIAPKFRLAWKTANWGAIVKIFLDQIEYAQVDTYAEIPGIVTLDVFTPTGMGMANGAHELWIEHSGTHNPLATPDANGNFTIQVIRKQLNPEEVDGVTTIFRQNPADACQLQQSIDDGENWTLAFDFGLCVTPAIASLLEINVGNITVINPAAPTQTFTSQDGDTDAQRQARTDGLCYASDAVVDQMAETALSLIGGFLTAQTLVAIALGLAGTILAVFVVGVSGGVLLTIGLAIASAALGAASLIQSAGAAAFESETVRDAMVCLMFQNLMNKGVTLENFQTAFDQDCLTGDEATVANVFSAMLHDTANAQSLYEGFLNLLAEAQGAALDGATIPSCICAAATWCYTWSLASPLPSVWNIEAGVQVADGVEWALNPIGNHGLNTCLVGPSRGAQLFIDLFIPDGVVLTEVRIYGIQPGGVAWANLWIDNTSCQQRTVGITPTPHTLLGFWGLQNITGHHILTLALDNNTAGASKVKMQDIQFSGTGLNPVAACDNC